MKARTRKTRWLLIALLFGLLAATGLMLTRHRHATVVTANDGTAPTQAAPQHPHATLLASAGGKRTLASPVDSTPLERHGHRFSRGGPSTMENSNTSPKGTGPRTSGSENSAAADPAGAATGVAHPQLEHPSSSGAAVPQAGAGDFASNGGYTPLDCELPAGCGASASVITTIRQPSGTSGGTPSPRTSQGSTQPTGDPGTTNTNPTSDNPPPGNGSGDPQQHSDPPGQGSNPPVASAPELDPATLAGALTLLLGTLAILSARRRRVRASR